jgi:hypothetical protein
LDFNFNLHSTGFPLHRTAFRKNIKMPNFYRTTALIFHRTKEDPESIDRPLLNEDKSDFSLGSDDSLSS